MSHQNEQDRRLPWEGCDNARDIGGYPTTDGGLVRRYALVRSDSPHQLTPKSITEVYDYGVRTVIDLRLPGELEREPSPFAMRHAGSPPRYLNLPMHDLATDALVDTADSTVDTYIVILEHSKKNIASIITAVAEGLHEGGVLINCHAGKDRTGIIVALLLSVAGVGREVIAQDYALSEVMLEPRYQEWVQAQIRLHGHVPDKPWQAQTRPETMYALLDYLDRKHGGVEGYLLAAGVDREVLEQIRNHLIEPIAL